MSVKPKRATSALPQPLVGGARGHIGTATSATTALTPNDSAWNLLYGALVQQLGVNPQNFQLMYPMTSWNWPTNNMGFTNAAQYDFCATIPQWSAIGAYVSSGATFDGAYQQFLNTIQLNTSNPQLQQQIINAQNNLTQAAQNLSSVAAQAMATYNSTVTGNNPTYTQWLGSPSGTGYSAQINALTNQVTAAQDVVNQLTSQQTTPNIANAQAAFVNQNYYTKLNDSSLSGFPAVPAWSLSQSAQQWVSQVQGGGGTGASLTISNSDATYSYSNTWAHGSTSVGNWFWQVYANGSWQQVQEFFADSSLSCTIQFAAWDTIAITPSKWYSGTTAFRNGPFIPNYTAFQQQGSLGWMFGQGGIIPAFKTGMLVCYQPTITINVSQNTYQSFSQQWSVSGGIQIGPFQIGGSGGGTTLNWTQSSSGYSATMASTSNVPLIFGINLAIQPQ